MGASSPPAPSSPRGHRFTWTIAARYLNLRQTRSWKVQLVSGAALALFIGTLVLSLVARRPGLPFRDLRLAAAGPLSNLRVVFGLAWVLLEAFVQMVRRFTIFATISAYGLFLGTAALILALSIMSGFEQDLKHKILGMHAHLDVTRDVLLDDKGAPAGDTPEVTGPWAQAAAARLRQLPDVVAVTPYLSNEVILSSSSNVSPVVIKGIDPATTGQVTDLERDIDVGELDYLNQPEKLRALGGLPPDLMPAPTIDLAKPSPGPTKMSTGDVKPPPSPSLQIHDPFLDGPRHDASERRVIPGIIIGRELARTLRVYLGDDVNVISPFGGVGPSGAIPKSKPFRVAGIFFSGMFEYDSNYVYIALPAAQKFFSVADGEVTGLEVKIKDADQSERAVDEVSGVMGRGFVVEDWKTLNRALFSALKLEKIAMFIVLSFIILVSAFSIVANGIMLVLEKGREIAILKSMGATDGQVLRIFLLLGLYIGALGTLLGVAVGVLGCWALGRFGLPLDPDVYYITSLPVHMAWREVVVVMASALGIALAATLYPAWLAARLQPVDGLREGNR